MTEINNTSAVIPHLITLVSVLIALLSSFFIYRLLRRAGLKVFQRLAPWGSLPNHPLRQLSAAFIAIVMEALTVISATVICYWVAMSLPIFAADSSRVTVLKTALVLAVYGYALRTLWQNRHLLSNACIAWAEKTPNALLGMALRFVAKVWAWVVLLYLTALVILSQTNQKNALNFMIEASIQSGLALLIGSISSLALSFFVTQRVHFSEPLNQSFPLLENRLNAYIPALFRLLRLLVLAAVVLSLFDAWQLIDLKKWLESGNGRAIIHAVIRIMVVAVLAALAWAVLASMIENRLSGSGQERTTEREKTLLMLFRNALAIVIITLSTLIVLSELGIDIGPLIAGAGVVGLAVGFGAQKLVQDVITGIFILLENGMNQNDIVEVAGLFGTVEKLTIRSVVIRTLDGGYHLVPFSSIDCVTNHTRDYGCHVGEYLISLDQSVDYAIEHLKAAFEELKKDEEVADAILEDMTIPGVTAIGREGTKIRIIIKTAPGMQWAVQRHFNRLVKQHFDAAGIEIPYPQTVLHFKP